MAIVILVVGMSAVPLSAAIVKPAATISKAKPVTAQRPTTDAQTNPLEAVIRRMRTAGKRIGRQEIGPETRALQQQVVSDLQKLIDQVRKGQSRRSRPSSSNKRPRPSPGSKSQPKTTASTDGGGKPQTGKSGQSTDRRDATTRPDRRIVTRRMLVKELWGHLPPALRQRLLNIEGAVPLPQYGQLVRRYFESLAEQDTRKPKP